MLNRDTDKIIVRAYIQLGDNALTLARRHNNGNEIDGKQQKLWAESFVVRQLLKALEWRVRQDYTVTNKLLSCLTKLSHINDYPAAPLLYQGDRNIILQAGPQGTPGTPGAAGSDADIVVQSNDDNITIIETAPAGVKTYTLSYTPYIQPDIVLTVNTDTIISPSSRYREQGESIQIPLKINLTKGKNSVTASRIVVPSTINSGYQTLLLPLTTINNNGIQEINLSNNSVVADQNYLVSISDGETSTTSVNIPQTHPTDVSLTISTNKNYVAGQRVLLQEDDSNYFIGTIKSYVALTGALVVTSESHLGVGSQPTTSWNMQHLYEDNIYFDYPILYGDSPTTSPTYYSVLSKLTRPDGGIEPFAQGSEFTAGFDNTEAYFWFGYYDPSNNINVVDIFDESGFNVTGDFSRFGAVSVSSGTFHAGNGGSDWNVNYTFYRTTDLTTITAQDFKFVF